MVNVRNFLKENGGGYALVTYEGRIEPTWFSNMGTSFNPVGDNDDWFLESPCELYQIAKVESDIDNFCKEYMECCIELEDSESTEEYINNFVKPMIIDGWLYGIENFQCSPYLPKEVDNIKLINERECLEYMLNNQIN